MSAQFGVFKLFGFSAVGCGVIIGRMSRLRRLVLSDRFFFITCRVYRPRGKLNEGEFSILAQVVRERRKKHRFLLTAWVLLPDHGHGCATRQKNRLTGAPQCSILFMTLS
jgi:hypothetical protein